jgi:cytochrome c biogenesis protein CcdA
MGKNKNTMLIAGFSFSFGVFATYMLLGIGLAEVISSLSMYKSLALVIKFSTLIMVLIFAILSFVDFILCIKNKEAKIILQLPKFLKRKIHTDIRTKMKKSSIIIGSLTLGFFVSAFELACTGQVYLPTIVYMLQVSSDKLTPLLYLVMYNIAFVLPLIIVFILAYFGLTAEKLGTFFRNKIWVVKLLTTLLFILFAILILVGDYS